MLQRVVLNNKLPLEKHIKKKMSVICKHFVLITNENDFFYFNYSFILSLFVINHIPFTFRINKFYFDEEILIVSRQF